MQPVQRRIEDVDRSRYDADYVGVNEPDCSRGRTTSRCDLAKATALNPVTDGQDGANDELRARGGEVGGVAVRHWHGPGFGF